jgi:hypothetical protein
MYIILRGYCWVGVVSVWESCCSRFFVNPSCPGRAVGKTNLIVVAVQEAQKLLDIEMCPDGLEHMPPAIEYMQALRECQVNCIYLRLIVICHKYQRGDPRALHLNQIQKKIQLSVACHWMTASRQPVHLHRLSKEKLPLLVNYIPWPQLSHAINVNSRIPLYYMMLWVMSIPRNPLPSHSYAFI